jgi:hypothetical protein
MKKQIWFPLFALILFVSALSQRAEAQAKIIVFDVPGSSCPTSKYFSCIYLAGVDAQGTVTGDYTDAKGVGHGFYRLADGTFASFDPPGANCAPPAKGDVYSTCSAEMASTRAGR